MEAVAERPAAHQLLQAGEHDLVAGDTDSDEDAIADDGDGPGSDSADDEAIADDSDDESAFPAVPPWGVPVTSSGGDAAGAAQQQASSLEPESPGAGVFARRPQAPPPNAAAAAPTGRCATTAATPSAEAEVPTVDAPDVVVRMAGSRKALLTEPSNDERRRFERTPKQHQLTLVMLGAKDLPVTDGTPKDGWSDPYVKMIISGTGSSGQEGVKEVKQPFKKTNVVRRSLNPRWNETFTWNHVYTAQTQ
eukprot:5623422-Prymnesium_polylepis.1